MLELPSLSSETLWAILEERMTDQMVNALLWHYLGYRYDQAEQRWDTSQVSTVWLEAYPEPPNFIDSRPATIKLTRSIPPEHKQLLKEELGFPGYRVDQLNPRRTRRATAVNWFLHYLKEHPESA
ncbi:MAG: DUF1823 family protein [Acaryochloridaceae cyanobacterium SU_2_1]|nr:DUF1823 family protein [Acaryochloridaceae cyanobacterium SU_2_1]